MSTQNYLNGKMHGRPLSPTVLQGTEKSLILIETGREKLFKIGTGLEKLF